MKRLSLYLCLMLITAAVKGQIGREFWFVAPDVWEGYGDTPTVIRVTTFDESATVKIQLPASNGRVLGEHTVAAHSQYAFVLGKKDIENTPADKVNNKGLLITSTADIAAYYDVSSENNPEKFVLKEDNALGFQFFVPSQNIYGNNSDYNSDANEKADIVATEDNTTITIVPSTDITGHQAGVSYSISLNRGQSYCIECRDISRNASLAGTEITADKLIAVTISDDSIIEDEDSFPHDLIGDQLIPIDVIGNEYVAINTSKAASSYKNQNSVQKVFVMAIEDNTMVFTNNTTKTTKALNKGEIAEFDISDHALYIYATRRVYAYQLTGLVNTNTSSANELASALLPGYSCNGSNSVSFTRVFNRDFWVNVIVKRKNVKNFRLVDNKGNDVNVGRYIKSWQTVPGQDTGQEAWVCCAVNLDNISTGTPYRLENTSGLFHLCILDESESTQVGGGAGFGYFSSYNTFRAIGAGDRCVGDEIVLTAMDGMKNYAWYSSTTGNNILSTDREYTVSESGTYWVEAEVQFGGCILADTLKVNFLAPVVELGNDTSVCEGQILTYSLSNSYANYNWSTGETGNSVQVMADGSISTLEVTVTDAMGCTNSDTIDIETVPAPAILLNTATVCEGSTIENTTNLIRYEWSYNGTVLNIDETQNWITPSESGTYTVKGWNAEGCSITETTNITVNPLPSLTLVDQTACQGESATIAGPVGFTSYLWSTGETTQSILLNAGTRYSLEVTDDNGCVANDEAKLSYYDPIPFDLTQEMECDGVNFNITNGNDYSSIEWAFIPDDDTANSNVFQGNSYVATYNGRYSVLAQDVQGCSVNANGNVTVIDIPEIVLNATNVCAGAAISVVNDADFERYQWIYNSVVLNAVEAQEWIIPGQSGTYTVVGWTTDGCSVTKDVNVEVYPLPEFTLNDKVDCEGGLIEATTSDVTITAGSAPFTYNWSETSFTTDATYSLELTDVHGCVGNADANISFNTPIPFDLGPDRDECVGISLSISNSSIYSNYNWTFEPASNSSSSVSLSPSTPYEYEITNANVSNSGLYRLEATDVNGCVVADEVNVTFHTAQTPLLQITENLCVGSTVEVIATEGYDSYTWQVDGTHEPAFDNQYRITGVTAGAIYSLVATAGTCKKRNEMTVVAHDLPIVTLPIDFSMCDGLSRELQVENYQSSSGAAFDYLYWNNDANLRFSNWQNASLTITGAGNYSVTAVDEFGCNASDAITIDVVNPSLFSLGSDIGVCENESVALDAAASLDGGRSYSYSWYKLNAGVEELVAGENTSGYTINQSGVFGVRAIDNYGCEVTDEVAVNVHQLPEVDLGDDQRICEGNDLVLKLMAFNSISGGDLDYLYWGNDPANIRDSLIVDSNMITGSTATYQITVVDEFGCEATDAINIDRLGLPTVTLPTDFSICDGQLKELRVENYHSPDGASFDYLFWNNNSNVRYSNWQSVSLLVMASGDYSVTAVDEFGCEGTDNIRIGMHGSTVVDLGEMQTACDNEIVTLTNPVANVQSYSWTKKMASGEVAMLNDAALDVTKSGTYVLKILDVNGCEASDDVVVNFYKSPEISLGDDQMVCGRTMIQLTTDETYTRYEWNDDPTLNTNELLVNQSGSFRLAVWNDHGCTAQDELQVTVVAAPIMDLQDSTVCSGTGVVLAGPSGNYNYLWNTGETTQTINASQGHFSLRVTDGNGCSSFGEVTVSWRPVPKVDLGPDMIICPVEEWVLDAGDGYASYEWHNGATSHWLKASLLDTVNTVTVTDEFGCHGFDSQTVKFKAVPPLELLSDTTVCSNSTLWVEIEEDYEQYEWSNGHILPSVELSEAGSYWLRVFDGCMWQTDTMQLVVNETPVVAMLDTTVLYQVSVLPTGGTSPYRFAINDEDFQESNVFHNMENGEHEFLIEDSNGCQVNETLDLNSNIDVDVPPILTPNGDGYNDIWNINGLDRLPDTIIRVFDRYGKLLAEYNASDPPWDGKYLGKLVPSDAYWYVIQLMPVDKVLKGHLTVKR